jgi:DNA modification methylase
MTLAEKKESNSLRKEDSSFHGWYRFVLSFPPHLIRKYSEKFGLGSDDVLFDPFCGTGTTVVEAKKLGIPSMGSEAHPFTAMVSRVKCQWMLDPDRMAKLARAISQKAERAGEKYGLPPLSFHAQMLRETPHKGLNGYSLPQEEADMIPTGFMSELPLGRLLILRHWIEEMTEDEPEPVREFFYVALAHITANGAGNFAFGPEIYRTKAKSDYDVLGHFAKQASTMIDDLRLAQSWPNRKTLSRIIEADARDLKEVPSGMTAVITSPPYPNEKDYTRTTRVESVLLRFIQHRSGLRNIKGNLLRSNTRNVFVADDDMDEIKGIDSIRKVCEEIEAKRIDLGKTSGFERLYHKVVAHYFGGMRRHLRHLKPKLKSGAKLAYVVGDQYSFLMVPVRTAALLAEVAESEGYKVDSIDLWRERVGTKIRNGLDQQKTVRIREEVLVLEKP